MSGVKWKGNWIKRRLLSIEPTGDGIVRYLRKKPRNNTIPEMISSTLKANINYITECIPGISSETYVQPLRQKKTKVKNLSLLGEGDPASQHMVQLFEVLR